jgi:hypothetical protein
MDATISALARLLFPGILTVFLGLYLLGLLSGVDAEPALLRAGGAAIVLAVLARLALGLLDGSDEPAADPNRAGES